MIVNHPQHEKWELASEKLTFGVYCSQPAEGTHKGARIQSSLTIFYVSRSALHAYRRDTGAGGSPHTARMQDPGVVRKEAPACRNDTYTSV